MDLSLKSYYNFPIRFETIKTSWLCLMESKTTDLESLDSVSKRLKYIIETVGVKQSHMAQKLGVSTSGLHYILNNDIKFSKNAKKIAGYLNINHKWLETGEGKMYEEEITDVIKTYKINIYSQNELKNFYRNHLAELPISSGFIISTTEYKNKVVAVYALESSFGQKFEPKDIIIFEQSSDFIDGEILLVYLCQINRIVISYGFHIENAVVLIQNNADPITLKKDSADIIIGSYRECFKKYIAK